ncbi:MAG: hypothetical protein QOI36_1005 [Pseudonocardiales bacterium]|nr:hypothetical protein [Pseudonocardia sp.]MDT7649599.1 hypothetical protein [Pseudonocardiales bacterium]
MLKKAGIIVAASAVSLLAVSPLAFAGEKGHGDVEFTQVSSDSHDCGNQKNEQAASASGLLNLLSGIAVQVPINALNCNELNILSNEINR